MRFAIGTAAGILTLAFSVPAAAQNFKIQSDLFGQKKSSPKPPAVDWNRGRAVEQAATSQASVICGMTVVPADPKGDPKMAVKLPDGGGVKYTLRTVEPAICKAR